MLYRFVKEAKINDFIVFPHKLTREISIGQIFGDYEYNKNLDFPHTRKVKWIKKYPRTKFSQGALYEIGSAMTFFQVKNYADEFIAVLENKEIIDIIKEDIESIGYVADDIEQQSRDFILKQISQKLKGHGFAEFAGHILDLMGYKTKVSEPGSDRGIDIIAYKDDLGVEPPVIIVQVKSSDKESNEAEVSQLYGKVTEKDFGLFISLSGFNKRASDFAFGRRNLKLLNGDDFIDLIYKYYNKIDGKYKAIIPLRKVYIPETPSE
jgi:restriction system protein